MPKSQVCCAADQYLLDHLTELLPSQEVFNTLLKEATVIMARNSTRLDQVHPTELPKEALAVVVFKCADHLMERLDEAMGQWLVAYLQEAAGISHDLAEYLLGRVAERTMAREAQDLIIERLGAASVEVRRGRNHDGDPDLQA